MVKSMVSRTFIAAFLAGNTWGYLGLIGVAQLAAIVFGQGSFAVSQAGEDGSFYIAIAQHMAAGGGATFDGFAPTTGVHWGWLFLLTGVFKLIPTTDPVTLFRIAAIAYYCTLFAAGCVIYRLAPLGALFMVAYLASRGHWYMETHLVLLSLALAIRWPGTLTGFLLVATRTDMIIFALFTRHWWLIIGALIGLYWVCVVNTAVDAWPISVSAQIKSAGFNDWDTIIRTIRSLARYYFPVLPIMVLLSLWDIDRWFLGACGLILVHILHNSATEGWYLAPLFLTSLLCSSRVLARAERYLWPAWRLVGV